MGIRTGELEDALKAVEHELPLGISEELKAQLAVEVFKATAIRDALLDVANKIDEISNVLHILPMPRDR